VAGYLLAKDFIAEARSDEDWTHLIRPIRAVESSEDVESTLMQMQTEAAAIYLVEDAGIPVGLVTLEDILEQVVGRIEDEYPHAANVSLRDAVSAGAVVLNLAGATREAVIEELAAAVPEDKLPRDSLAAELAIARELELSTDLGVGVAFPHARSPSLTEAVLAFGRSAGGVTFSAASTEPVRLVFLLITPEDQLDLHLSLLGKLARLARDESMRNRLCQAGSQPEVLEILDEVTH
jgi:mannitol/fructose-specific phosphotransferase system IIA component (Ntr-type)